MNDFFTWAMQNSRLWEHDAPLSSAELDELLTLFSEAGLPSTAMDLEMADGYIAGCVASPNPVPTHLWMETLFGQPTLPICVDAVQQERLLQLLVHRFADTHEALRTHNQDVTVNTVYDPLFLELADGECITPYQLDAQGQRIGAWRAKQWALGFKTAVEEDADWDRLVEDQDAYILVGAVLLFSVGYNSDRPAMQIDTDPDLLPTMVYCVYRIVDYWRTHPAGVHTPATLPFVRDTPKVGRNDPCTCGSGKKFKKCCGAH